MNDKRIKVGIILGSASDMQHAQRASAVLESLGVAHEVGVASAHRTPVDAVNYAKNAAGRGLSVIIAIAGLSAALPGVVAAHTSLPVIGVPVDAGTLGGLDALLSIAQMPSGVPVGSVGVNGEKNAALLAARIVALTDESARRAIEEQSRKGTEDARASRVKISPLPQAPEEAFA